MSFSRKELAENLIRLKDNGHWRHYVLTLESAYNDRVTQLVTQDHPDEALRGECRVLHILLKQINLNHGSPPT